MSAERGPASSTNLYLVLQQGGQRGCVHVVLGQAVGAQARLAVRLLHWATAAQALERACQQAGDRSALPQCRMLGSGSQRAACSAHEVSRLAGQGSGSVEPQALFEHMHQHISTPGMRRRTLVEGGEACLARRAAALALLLCRRRHDERRQRGVWPCQRVRSAKQVLQAKQLSR